jgi:hypothetical protein
MQRIRNVADWSGARRIALFLPLLAIYALVILKGASPFPVGDEGTYLTYAQRITEGHYSTRSAGEFAYLWFGPGLPLLLAPLVALNASLDVLRLADAVFLFGAALAFDRLLQLVHGRRIALLGAYALGLYPPFPHTLLQHTFSEPLAMLSAAFGMLFMAKAMRTGAVRHMVLSSVGFAWLALTRIGFGWILTALLLIFLGIWLFQRRRMAGNEFVARRAAAIFALALALCAPWLVYTHSETGHVYYWGTSGGLNLYWMASPYPGDLGDWKGVTSTDPHHAPFFRSLRHLGPVEKNARIQSKALRLIRDHPTSYLKNLPPNVSRLFLQTPFTNNPTNSITKRAAYAVPSLVILGVLALCLPRLLRDRRRLPPEALPFAMFAAVGIVFHSLLAAEGRMLMPLVPALLWFAIYGLAAGDASPLRAASRRKLRAYA